MLTALYSHELCSRLPARLLQGEFKVTERTMGMKELLGALEAGRILEVFGAGTACVVCPVGSLLYGEKVRALTFPRVLLMSFPSRVLLASAGAELISSWFARSDLEPPVSTRIYSSGIQIVVVFLLHNKIYITN